ncbi:hypothetical protein GGTG_12944 [Gaeumannomyces tritici R3-111a-1]|uniref:RING-CH-type domain-containing protein n=1 Tax=Gaeumannomyces tritici (strain R3-111a-1) TaxID=644352 RepID=J3PHG4_GAET3|nr:hypothetical protein GGTG_12944 [Gaeumannomyces tritici R3-111a-1]EJT69325.1 hypothetical protein GGTG_12944 [Gaeumannomyces tritici R3-111a-1]
MDEPSAPFKSEPSWSWGDAIPASASASTGAEPVPQSASAEGLRARSPPTPQPNPEPKPEAEAEPQVQPQHEQGQQRQRHYRPRQCRICLDTVPPTFDTSESGIFGSGPRVRYISEDPELGRLMSPCRCKGSQRYVHEGCLQAWRQAAPLSDRNFWHCPTCKFQYRMSRLRWASWLSNKLTRMGLTLVVLFMLVFFLGFIADPIINLYVDPWGWLFGFWSDVSDDWDDLRVELEDEESFGWYLHFFKGVLSLSLVGAVQAFTTMNPFTWWQLRGGGIFGGGTQRGRRGGGRDRMENINLAVIVVGLFTILVATWKLVSALSSRALEKVSEQVMDIQGDDEDDDGDDDSHADADDAGGE